MKIRLVLASWAVIAAGAYFAGFGMAEDEPAAPEQPSEEEMMKEMLALGEPGERHAEFQAFVGEWTGKATMYMNGESATSEASISNELTLGGRFLRRRYKGTMADMPFLGVGILGYDNYKKEYQSLWLDSMSSNMYTSKGQKLDDGKTISVSGVWDGPMGAIKMRHAMRVTGPDTYTETGYMMQGEQEVKTMEIEFTRVK